ncbi:MAG: MogA/MoaB family molybdenum cofactor biosynthesis protein [Clostridia bacterium]|nr:MogA/MoaB family molybdenum cofactor biosynthesis protein [Clostridia bacterium]
MFEAAVLTVSDKGFRGEREDTAGPLAAELLGEAGYAVIGVEIVPDERPAIEAALIRLADETGAALIVTTGGTGFSPRDITPEATLAVVERVTPGIPEAMRVSCLPLTDRAMLSRAAAGIRGRTLIVNLPGSPKAVRENLAPVLPALRHGLEMLRGTKSECASL